MKVLVTGHKGFIGTQIFKMVGEDGYDITGFDIGDPFPTENYDFIVHFAARTLIRKSRELPYEYFCDGEDLTLRMLELARKTGARIVFPTSGSEVKATNPYSLSKKNAVNWIDLYNEMYGVQSYVLKLFNIYGERSRKGIFYFFCNAALKGEEAVIYGDGEHRRDFTHVSDVGKVVLEILRGSIRPGTYEVGTGIPTSVNELKTMIENETGRAIAVRHEDYQLDEAEDLHAGKPVLDHFLSIKEGIRLVAKGLKAQ